MRSGWIGGAASLTIEVGESRNGQHIVEPGRAVAIGVGAVISGRNRECNPGVNSTLDGVVLSSAVTTSAETHVRHFDRAGHPCDPIDASDHHGLRATPVRIEHLYRPDAGPWGHPDHTKVVVECTDRAGHVCAVIVIVVAAGGARRGSQPPWTLVGLATGNAASDIEIGVFEIDTGVDNCHIDIDAVVIV